MYHAAASDQASLHWWTKSTASSIPAPISSFDLDSPRDAAFYSANLHNLEADDYLISEFLDLPYEEIEAPACISTRQYPSPDVAPLSNAQTCTEAAYPNVGNSSTTDKGIQDGAPDAPNCEGGDDFDWFASFNDNTLIYGASNFEVSESFLFINSPLLGCDGTKEGGLGSSDGGGKHESNSNVCATYENKACDQSNVAPALRAKSKRPRTGARTQAARSGRVGNWSSVSSILAPWKESTPTPSMDSTSSEVLHDDHAFSCSQAPDSSPSTDNTSFSSHSTVVDDEDIDVPQQRINSSMTSHEDVKGSYTDQFPPQKIGNGSDSSVTMKWTKSVNWEEGEEGAPVRRCTHCLSTKTPQWRAGPAGPKTLCNACGVRFKSGRLFDEYRPAKSPTFLSYKHSNSHKRVLEMRHRKGLDLPTNSNSSSCSNSSLANSIRQPCRNGFKRLKIKLPRTQIDPHLPEVALINPPALESPNFII